MDIADSIFIAGNVYFHSNEVTYIYIGLLMLTLYLMIYLPPLSQDLVSNTPAGI